MKQRMKFEGNVIFELRDKDGNLKMRDEVKNGITDAGFDAIAARLFSSGSSSFAVIGIGDSDTAFSASQTDLQGSNKYRKTGSYAHTVGTKIVTITTTWGVDEPIAGTVTVKEVGLFDNTVGGNMLSRLTRSVITKLSTDVLTVIYTITMS